MAMVEQGANALAGSGFFNCMLGGGDAVTGGGGCGGGNPAAFDLEDGKVVRCGLLFGRTWLKCEDTALGALADGRDPSGAIYASVSHRPGQSPELTVRHGSSLPENGLDVTNRLLYEATSDGLWADYRNAATIVAMD